jgi:hypothetical protein
VALGLEPLVGGATPADHVEAEARRERREALDAGVDAYWQARRRGYWIDPDTGWRVDVSEHDAPPSEPPLPPIPGELSGKGRYLADPSPHVIRSLACAECGRPLRFYGREDVLHRLEADDRIRCDVHQLPDREVT